jgi:hypothetical protein
VLNHLLEVVVDYLIQIIHVILKNIYNKWHI